MLGCFFLQKGRLHVYHNTQVSQIKASQTHIQVSMLTCCAVRLLLPHKARLYHTVKNLSTPFLFFAVCQHKLDSVFLIYLGSSRVVVDGDYVYIGIFLLYGLHHSLAADMVRQASEGLCANDIFLYPCRQAPAFPR